MKVNEYICDRCGRKIDPKGVYTVVPKRLDPKEPEVMLGIPDEVSDRLYDLIYNKHLCLDCLHKVLIKAFKVPAVINQEFEKALEPVGYRAGILNKFMGVD